MMYGSLRERFMVVVLKVEFKFFLPVWSLQRAVIESPDDLPFGP